MRAFALLLSCVASAMAPAQSKLYAAWYGDDAWSGALKYPNTDRSDGPKATLVGARDAIRTLRANGTLSYQGAVVEFADGGFQIARTVEFTAEDSGTAAGPIVYRAEHPHGAFLGGSTRVQNWGPPSATLLNRLRPEARPHVLAADLKAIGLTSLGTLNGSNYIGDDWDQPSSYNELYVNGARQTIARWPNVGYARVTLGGSTTSFQADLSTCRAAANDSDLWLYSFAMGSDWAFQNLYASVDCASNTIRLPSERALLWNSQSGGRFFVRNSLEELDAPGEYYVDRASGTMLWYPKPGEESYDGRIGSCVGRSMIKLSKVSNVQIEGFSMGYAPGQGIDVVSCTNVNLVGIDIQKLGGYAVEISSSLNCTVDSCSMDNLGEGGVRTVDCGDYKTLTPGNVTVQNCRISNFGLLVPSYRPGVMLTGVGNSVLNNDIVGGPHEGMHVQGINLLVKNNYVTDVCRDTSDAGAIYVCGSVIERGSKVSGNVVSDARNHIDHGGIWAIYLDGRVSGITVKGNIVRRSDCGIFVNAGRNNRIANNALIDCKAALQIDDAHHVAYNGLETLSSVPYSTGVWAQQFPELTTLLNDAPTYAKYNVFSRNAVIRCGQMILWRSAAMYQSFTMAPQENLEVGWLYNVPGGSEQFVDETRGNLCPASYSSLWWLGFHELHESDAGVRSNEYIQSR